MPCKCTECHGQTSPTAHTPPVRRPICHHYANGCVCVDCVERSGRPNVVKLTPRQPWEMRPAA